MRRMFLLVATLGGLMAAPARAQLDTQEDAIRAMHVYGWCVVRNDSSASSILGLPPGSEAERALLRRLANPDCVSGRGFAYTLDYEPQLLRGVIAEEVLRLGDGSRTNGRTIRWAAPFTALTEADIGALDERGRTSLSALEFAQCIVADAPEVVTALLETGPETLPEERAVQALSPFLGPCLPAGAQISISKPQLRAFLAEAAYRAAYAASQWVADQGGEG